MAALSDLTRPPRAPDGLAQLLAWEAGLREQESVPELTYYLANEGRGLLGYDQLFVVKRPLVGDGWHVAAASGLAQVDRNAPAIRAIEAAVRDMGPATTLDAPNDEALDDYPFRAWLWQPLVDRSGAPFAALLLAREHDYADEGRAQRVAETAQHGWLALTGGKPARRLPRLTPKQKKWIAAAAAGVALFPVHLSALAPVEVVAAHPAVITAPIAGVITAVDVAPSAQVAAGQPLIRFDDVKLRNELSLAAERLQVARAKTDEVASASFGDQTQARGISIAQAEYQLAAAEHSYARDMLARSTVRAPKAGLAIYTDRREWEGRAVEVGQPIMEIADPRDVRYRIDLPAREQLSLSPGSTVSVWLDSQPLWSESATLADASYQARTLPDGTLAFALEATPAGGTPPRIGSRGTARVRGSWAPLAYAALKHPIAGFRQFVGF